MDANSAAAAPSGVVTGTRRDTLEELATTTSRTPLLLIDEHLIAEAVTAFRTSLPGVDVRYAVKANPHPAVLNTMAQHNVGFDVASASEAEAAHTVGAHMERDVIFGAPIKSPEHIRRVAELGVRTFVADCADEVDKLGLHAPGTDVLIRIAVSNDGSVFDLTEKFGATSKEVPDLVEQCTRAGLNPIGYTFHVGSQSTTPTTWVEAILRAAQMIQYLPSKASERPVLDLGGGFPLEYGTSVPSIQDIAAVILTTAADCLPKSTQLIAEPGRRLIGEAGTLVATVIGTAIRAGQPWAYLDVGVYNGYFEALAGQGRFRFPVLCTTRSGPKEEWVVAGPSCDSLDRMPGLAHLPRGLTVGDRVLIRHVGAYSLAFASHFCGWPIPEVRAIRAKDSDVFGSQGTDGSPV